MSTWRASRDQHTCSLCLVSFFRVYFPVKCNSTSIAERVGNSISVSGKKGEEGLFERKISRGIARNRVEVCRDREERLSNRRYVYIYIYILDLYHILRFIIATTHPLL